jgi:hypothetical protein
LYDDDGETQSYREGNYQNTLFEVSSDQTGFKIESSRMNKDYIDSIKNLSFEILDTMPLSNLNVNGQIISLNSNDDLSEEGIQYKYLTEEKTNFLSVPFNKDIDIEGFYE